MPEHNLRLALSAYRQQFKACQRTMRATVQMLADLEERLAALEDAQPPEEAQRNGTGNKERVGA